LQSNGGDDSPNLYFHGVGRYLSMDTVASHYRFISEAAPGVGGYILLDCDGSGVSAAGCTAYGFLAAPRFHETLTTPASSTAGCTAGDFTDDADYHYVCVAANVWKRAALSAW